MTLSYVSSDVRACSGQEPPSLFTEETGAGVSCLIYTEGSQPTRTRGQSLRDGVVVQPDDHSRHLQILLETASHSSTGSDSPAADLNATEEQCSI